MPVISGFEGQSVLVFEVVDPQNPAAAASRLVEYLVEIGELDQAAMSSLRPCALIRGRFGCTGGPRPVVGCARRSNRLRASGGSSWSLRVTDGADRFLPWDRRVSVSLCSFARWGTGSVRARNQVRRCLTELTEKKLRSLSRLEFALPAAGPGPCTFELEIADVKLRALALGFAAGRFALQHLTRPGLSQGAVIVIVPVVEDGRVFGGDA